MRCDLHVHSKYSGAVNIPGLRRLARESYSEPAEVYRTAMRRGMDLVTITDHNSIAGALQIAHLPDVFVSEEVTCRMPSGNVVHLGVFDVDERRHQTIQARRDDAEALFAYLAEQRLPFCVNHPFSPLTGRRDPADLRMPLERASAVEGLNGMMPRASNAWARRVAGLDGRPCVGGSDAHALGSVARAFTEVRGARTREEFLAGLRAGRTLPVGRSGSYARLTADVASIFLGALGENAGLAGRSPADLGRFVGVAALIPAMALMPVITAANFARERIMADVNHRRYRNGRPRDAGVGSASTVRPDVVA